MYKRGQVALFVVMAIIIVGGAVGILYTQTGLFKGETLNPEIAPIKSFIDNCVSETGKGALFIIGQQGGYFQLPALSLSRYPYYFYGNKSLMPSKSKIETELAGYMNDNLPLCIENFANFSDFDITTESQAVSKVTILADKVNFDVSYRLSIKKGDAIYGLSSFSTEIPSRLNTIYNVVQSMIQEQLKDPSSICISCNMNLASDNNLFIDDVYTQDDRVFIITDNQTLIDGNSFEFKFANHYG
jgi:regulator of extracellular matrix RemA (YlzA/DUF370 family)